MYNPFSKGFKYKRAELPEHGNSFAATSIMIVEITQPSEGESQSAKHLPWQLSAKRPLKHNNHLSKVQTVEREGCSGQSPTAEPGFK